jgi:hypothetical protein
MNKKTILNMLGLTKDPREEEYLRWLQSQGGGGVPIREDYGAFDPSLSYDVQQEFDQAGYDEAMGEYDWKRKLENMQNKRFYASLANVFAPQKGAYGKGGSFGPASRPFADPMRMRYWS